MKKNQLLAALYSAWELLLDIPCPPFIKQDTAVTGRSSAMAVLLAIPFVGLICGAAVVLILRITGMFLTQFGNAFLFAVVMTLFILCKDSARGFRLLLELIRDLASRERSFAQSLPLLRPRPLTEINDMVSTLSAFLICGFQLLVFTYLAYRNAMLWAVPVLLMGVTIQGHLLGLRNLRGGTPFLAGTEKNRNKLWVLTGFLMLFPAIDFPLAALVTFGVCYVFALGAQKGAEEWYGGCTSEMITIAGLCAELTALFCGLLLIR